MILRLALGAAAIGSLLIWGLSGQKSETDTQSFREVIKEKIANRSSEEEKSLLGLSDRVAEPVIYPERIIVERDIAYGTDPLEKMDVYSPVASAATVKSHPAIMMVHGGGWKRGDKVAGSALQNKLDYFVARGYVLASINYPLDPINPEVQVNSVAKALAYLQTNAAEFGINTNQIVIMGHSAGAHLVSLLTADQAVREKNDVKPWVATISLDSAAYDVVSAMEGRHFALYDDAFGTDSLFWAQVSPFHRYTKSAEPFLLICSSTRAKSVCNMTRDFAAKVNKLGGKAEVVPYPYSHSEINSEVGAPGDYTDKIQAFLDSVNMP